MPESYLRIIFLGLAAALVSISSLGAQRLALDKYAGVESARERVRVASVAVLPDKWDKSANWGRIERLVRTAVAEGGAELVVTPEGALEGYVINEVNAISDPKERAAAVARFRDLAEPLAGPYGQRASRLARELGVFLLLGFLESEGEAVYNTAALFDPEGDVVGRYRKTHFAQGYAINPSCYQAGEDYPVISTPLGRFGILICYDRQLPEPARVLALKGAQCLLLPSYGSYGITDDWNTNLLRTRAYENRFPLVFSHPFQSLLIDRYGHLKAKGEANEVVYADLRLGRPDENAQLRNRRPSLFQALVEEPAPVALSDPSAAMSRPLKLVGTTVTPHMKSDMMRYRREGEDQLGARVELFLKNSADEAQRVNDQLDVRFDGKTPAALLAEDAWAWHDTPSAREGAQVALPPGAMTVWAFNSKTDAWGVGTEHVLEIDGETRPEPLALADPEVWLSAVTFTGPEHGIEPDLMTVHVANDGEYPLTLKRCRLWLPREADEGGHFLALHPQPWRSELQVFSGHATLEAGDRGGFRLQYGRLPLSYAAVEVELVNPDGDRRHLWAHLRIKKEVFDISGGWISSDGKLGREPYLKTLKRMHVNTGQIQEVGGFTDRPELYERYPIKRFNRLDNFERYDQDQMLPYIHAVEFLGEPQYGGGTPVAPQDVWKAFVPYHGTRLHTSVTHSEERIWRYYAGLSDYPHYDAYRVTAPAADAWWLYDRWGGEQIRWGAPLETIGDMTRSLRELNRPRSIAYWSQGAHGWRSRWRERGSPTAEELRSQAYQALGQRITSLYWFNLSLKSLLLYPDLIGPITRVGREIRVMENLLIAGDAYEFRTQGGWDLSSVLGPEGGLLFANDIAYEPIEKAFQFKKRDGRFSFGLPAYMETPAEVFALGPDGPEPVDHRVDGRDVIIEDEVHVVGVYVLAVRPGMRAHFQQRWQALLQLEASFEMNPATDDEDLQVLRDLLDE